MKERALQSILRHSNFPQGVLVRIRKNMMFGFQTRSALRYYGNYIFLTNTPVELAEDSLSIGDTVVGKAKKLFFFRCEAYVFQATACKEKPEWVFSILPSTTKLVGGFPRGNNEEILTLEQVLTDGLPYRLNPEKDKPETFGFIQTR